MKKITATLLLSIAFFAAIGQGMSKEYQKVVSDFIQCIKSQNKEKLLTKISFPFSREYPIPQIKNKQEFLNRYNEVFDDSLTKMIINSNPSKDWSAVGWRGIMLFNGDVWIDYDGRLIAVNYQSKVERKMKAQLVKADANGLYESLRKFDRPICILETNKYKIRIDDLGNGNYRYASWGLKSKMSDKPDIVIYNGILIPEGSGGNHRYEFKNGDYVYDCEIIEMGDDKSPPASLIIYKGAKEILIQDAKIITK